MEQQQLEEFRTSLHSLREETQQLLNTNADAQDTVMLDQSKVGRLSRMDAMQSQQMARETTRRRQLLLQQIEAALRRIESGDYGYCLECGEEISLGRLEFDPTSTWCMCERDE